MSNGNRDKGIDSGGGSDSNSGSDIVREGAISTITAFLQQWITKCARLTGRQTCLLCGLPLPVESTPLISTPSKQHDLCPDCQLELPRITTACRRCGLPLAQSAERCGDCLREPPVFASCQALFQYRHPIGHLITRFKQHHHLPSERWLLAEICHAGHHLNREQSWDALVATPLHWRRLWRRGFNQSYILCRALARELDCPIIAMRRRRSTRDQKRLNKKQRQQNLIGAFSVKAPLTGLRILLVDDVVTTGATANAVATTLYAAGAARVDLLALARTPKPASQMQFVANTTI